jgi:hypothetical protein
MPWQTALDATVWGREEEIRKERKRKMKEGKEGEGRDMASK